MSRNTSEVLVERLIDWGVGVVFGLPGDGINGIMEALRIRQDRISFLQGTARGSGRINGVWIRRNRPPAALRLPRHIGSGSIHLLNGSVRREDLCAHRCSRSPARRITI